MRRLLLGFGGVALSLLLGLVVAEVCLRVFSLSAADGVSTVSEAEFGRIPGEFSPGQRVVDRSIPALPHAVRIDSLGYRGADFPIHKNVGELRVLAIGDSFTFGSYVDDDKTLPVLLEKDLTRRCARPVTVINAGVGGSTITTAIQMLRRAWVTSPDVVVLTFVENDVDDLRRDYWGELAENRRAKSRFPLSVAYPVLRRLALWHLALTVRSRMRAPHVEVSAVQSPGHVTAEVEALRGQYAQVFGELSAEVRTRGLPLVLVAYPGHLMVKGAEDDEQFRWLEQVARRDSVPTVNLLQPLRATGLPVDSLYLLPWDGHASPRANEVAGAQVAERMGALGICEGAANARHPRQ